MNRAVDAHPVRLVVTDDLRRSQATVFARLLLAIPHIAWILVWSVVVILAAIVGWVAALLTGRLPAGLHRFFCSYIRYSAHFFGYMTPSRRTRTRPSAATPPTRSTSSCPARGR